MTHFIWRVLVEVNRQVADIDVAVSHTSPFPGTGSTRGHKPQYKKTEYKENVNNAVSPRTANNGAAKGGALETCQAKMSIAEYQPISRLGCVLGSASGQVSKCLGKVSECLGKYLVESCPRPRAGTAPWIRRNPPTVQWQTVLIHVGVFTMARGDYVRSCYGVEKKHTRVLSVY